MLSPKLFINLLEEQDIEFFAGVPDSLLRSFCACVSEYAKSGNHLMCVNEGSAVGIATGYHLATNKIAVVYMQNSGLGNAINPLISIADRDVYSIPVLLVIGWRGEPGHKDEPQHKKQGRITLSMLKSMEIPYEVITGDFKEAQCSIMKAVEYMKHNSAPFALVVQKGAFDSQVFKDEKKRSFPLKREEAIQAIIDSLKADDVVVSTTGMISREVFEYRERVGHGHNRDFLTVGGMGHASQIALGIALKKPEKQIFCLDGDGSLLMHMGVMATNGVQKCKNYHHIVINNGAHDSVGGQPTIGFDIDFKMIAQGSKYNTILGAETRDDIASCIALLKGSQGPSFLEIRVNKGAREDLGRPSATPVENKQRFMRFLKGLQKFNH